MGIWTRLDLAIYLIIPKFPSLCYTGLEVDWRQVAKTKEQIQLTAAIIGAGEIGRAVDTLLTQAGRKTILWDSSPKQLEHMRPLFEVLAEADIVFFCVPSDHLREAIVAAQPYLNPGVLVGILTKGYEAMTGQRVDEVAFASLPRKIAPVLLGGPMIAEEIKRGHKSAALLACRDQRVSRAFLKLFQGSELRLEPTDDIKSVALAGILKNVYTLPVGIVDGLGLGTNARGIVYARAVLELPLVMDRLGGSRKVMASLAGLADFFATSTSPDSKNHTTGVDLAKNINLPAGAEGVSSVETVASKLGRATKNFPLLKTVVEIVAEPESARNLMLELLSK